MPVMSATYQWVFLVGHVMHVMSRGFLVGWLSYTSVQLPFHRTKKNNFAVCIPF